MPPRGLRTRITMTAIPAFPEVPGYFPTSTLFALGQLFLLRDLKPLIAHHSWEFVAGWDCPGEEAIVT